MFEHVSSAIVQIDKDGKIIKFSKEAVMLTGFTEAEILGKGWHETFDIEHTQGICPIEKREPCSNIRVAIRTKSGIRKPFLINSLPLSDRIVIVIVGLSRLYHLERELRKEKGELSAILNSIADGVFTINTDWIITNFNPAAARITGYTREEAIGRPCHEIFRSETCRGNCPLRRTIETGEMVLNFEMEIFTKDGRPIPISVSTALLIDEEGEVIGGVETFRDLSTLRRLSDALKEKFSFGNIIGKDPKMQRVYELIRTVSITDATVLILGETGTGKDLVAQAIHFNSLRKDKPFVKVSCAALPESLLESELFGYKKGAFTGAVRDKPGRFELANGGTIFLDEVGDMPLSIQAKLLRVLEECEFEPLGGTKTKKVDVRIIAATNRDLAKLVEEGKFRQDLYYRLNVVTISLPPLKERSGDIPLLIDHFIDRFNRKMGKHVTKVSPDAMDILIDYDWPGNVRQLEHAIEHAFIHCQGNVIKLEHLPDEITSQRVSFLVKTKTIAELEKELIVETLKKYRGNRKKTAQALGISRVTLWRWIKRYRLSTQKSEKNRGSERDNNRR
ncbi:Fis family transcriptional regulator [candidate division WOR-3 bacterium]|uniref:Fis family transcriptional regulator n=1 Tax=candidate division WOR-3 bacterium TaxID=2052148 RepID=A0A660SI18_UNCW3|nr:MAG: Fis family transcriptional regulator [candidate division WOR-3 bacterium]